MSDTQLAGTVLLLAVVVLLAWRWLHGRSPASLYRDELGPRTLTEAQQHQIRLAFRRPRPTVNQTMRGDS